MNDGSFDINTLAERVNAWCRQHYVEPLHARVGAHVTVRNIRYYQTLGLVDRPSGPHGLGFTEKHRLQLIAIRLLQAKGLPLNKIQSLLYGRSEEDLRQGEQRGLAELEKLPVPPLPPAQTNWQVVPINGEVFLLSRARRVLTPLQRQKILEILNASPSKESPAPVETQALTETEEVTDLAGETEAVDESMFRPEFD